MKTRNEEKISQRARYLRFIIIIILLTRVGYVFSFFIIKKKKTYFS